MSYQSNRPWSDSPTEASGSHSKREQGIVEQPNAAFYTAVNDLIGGSLDQARKSGSTSEQTIQFVEQLQRCETSLIRSARLHLGPLLCCGQTTASEPRVAPRERARHRCWTQSNCWGTTADDLDRLDKVTPTNLWDSKLEGLIASLKVRCEDNQRQTSPEDGTQDVKEYRKSQALLTGWVSP